jgi:hypothetical protein
MIKKLVIYSIKSLPIRPPLRGIEGGDIRGCLPEDCAMQRQPRYPVFRLYLRHRFYTPLKIYHLSIYVDGLLGCRTAILGQVGGYKAA